MHRITNTRRRLSSSSDNRTLSLVELESSQLRSALLHPNQPQDSFAQPPPQTLQISALHLIQAQQQQGGASLKKKLRKSVSVLPGKKAASQVVAPYPTVTSQWSKNKASIDPPVHGKYLSPKYPPKAPVMTSRQPQVCVHGSFVRKHPQKKNPPKVNPASPFPPKASGSAAPTCGKSSQKVINLELDLNLKGGNLDDVVISSVHAEVSASPTLGESPATKKACEEKVRRKHVTVPIQVNFRRSWNYMSKEEKENLVERLSDKISTMTLQVLNAVL